MAFGEWGWLFHISRKNTLFLKESILKGDGNISSHTGALLIRVACCSEMVGVLMGEVKSN